MQILDVIHSLQLSKPRKPLLGWLGLRGWLASVKYLITLFGVSLFLSKFYQTTFFYRKSTEKGSKDKKEKESNMEATRLEDKSYLSLENPTEDDKQIKEKNIIYFS